MFQVLATIFFLFSIAAAAGAIVMTLSKNMAEIRAAFGLAVSVSHSSLRHRSRRAARTGVSTPRVLQPLRQRVAA